MEFRCKNPHVPTVYEFSKIPLERTPDTQATVYVWESLSFGMPGDAWGMLELDTACGNDRGHGPTKCLFPDGSSTPRLGDCPDFWGYFNDCNPPKKDFN